MLDGDRLVGVIDQSDLLHAAVDGATGLRREVREVMSTRLRTVAPSAPLAEVVSTLADGYTPRVLDGSVFLGLVTAVDVVSHVRRSARG